MDKTTLRIQELQKKIAEQNGILEQYFDTVDHSDTVFRVALMVACRINLMQEEKHISLDLLRHMCFAHDTGRMVTGSKASKELEEGIMHGYEGARILRENRGAIGLKNDKTFETILRCCESHINGAGPSAKLRSELRIKYPDRPYSNFDSVSLEEKVVGFSDMIVFANRNIDGSFSPYVADLEKAYEKIMNNNPGDPDYPFKLDKLVNEIYDLTTSRQAGSLVRRPRTVSKKDMCTIIYTLCDLSLEKKEYPDDTKQLASVLKDITLEYARNGKKENIKLEEFREQKGIETDDYCLSMTPFGLREDHGYLIGFKPSQADPGDWSDTSQYLPFSVFERIIEKYKLDTKKVDDIAEKCFLEKYEGVCEYDDDPNSHPTIAVYAGNDKRAISKIQDRAFRGSGKDYNLIVESIFKGGHIIWSEY